MNGVLEQANSIGKAFVAFAGPMLIQSSVLILILLLADWLLRRRVRAVLRYWIWMLVLIKLVLPTSLSLPMSLGYWFGDKLGFVEVDQTSEAEQTIRIPQPRRIPAREQATPFEPISAGPTEPAPVPRPEHASAEPVNPPRVSLTPLSWRGAVFLAWLAVVTAMALLLLQRAIFVRGLVARARAADSSMKDILASCCERMAVERKVGLKVSPNASSPAVCGLLHPVILVPENLAPSLGSKRLRAVLTHELAHIKRGDLWVNLAQTFLQVVYFYNPLLWLANAIIRRVREQAVDEVVLVAMGQAAQQYPQTLLEVAKLTFEQPALSLRLIGVVESKDALAGRIKHILNRPIPKTAKLGLLGLLVVILAAVILLPMAGEKIEIGLGPEREMALTLGWSGEAVKIPAPVVFPEWGRRTKEFRRWKKRGNIRTFITYDVEGYKYVAHALGFLRLADGRQLENIPTVQRFRPDGKLEADTTFINGEPADWRLYDEQGQKKVYVANYSGATDRKRGVVFYGPRGAERKKWQVSEFDVVYAEMVTDPNGRSYFSHYLQELIHSPYSRTYSAALSNGVTVELIGLCEHPSEGKKWWRPDGAQLKEAPYDYTGGNVYPDQNERAFEFAIKLSNLPNEPVTTTVKTDRPGSSSGGNSPPQKNGKYLDNFRWLATVLPRNQKTCDVLCGIAAGPWGAVAQSSGKDFSGQVAAVLGGVAVAFSKAFVQADGVSITVTDDVLERPCQIVAITDENRLIKPSASSSIRVGKSRQTSVSFKGLAPSAVREFQFQTRPYQWVTFKNVFLEPGVKTAVQVETDKGREMRSNADARISFISADEGEDEKSYRWGITRSLPLKVIQGWYEFDEGGIRSHGGGGRKIAEARPRQLTLRVSKENGFLVLHRGYAWSSTAGDQQADVGCKIEWPAGAVLRTYYLSEPVELTDKLQPVWKGELIQDSIVSKSVVYAVRVVGENVPDEVFGAGDTSEALRISRAWAPSPDPAKKRYEGRTIEQWIAQWDSRSYDDTRSATEALTRIGRPAVPAMIELMKKGGNLATRARTVLGNMGPQAEQALDWLIATALDKKPTAAQDKHRINAVICLSYMTWAADRLMPVFKEIAEDRQADTGVRRVAISGLQRIGGEAMPILQKIADSEQGEIRDSARRALSERLAKQGVLSRQDYYTQLVEEDPFDPSVPKYLTSAKGVVNLGRPHALTNKVKAMYRQRLRENPDPELAWRLATIVQNGLRNTDLEWAAPADSGKGRQPRQDPAESYVTLAEVLELGFRHAQPDSQLWRDFGIALAKLRLLQGDWERMNETLKRLGREPIPTESRPWLSAPPVDWGKDLHTEWQTADESMRSGDCSLEFLIEKDGKGLKGVHFLVKKAPEPTRVFRTGFAADTLFYAPHPIESYRDSFGYRGNDREETRYAVSDESGIVRFDRLPDIPIKVEVLVPTSNFPEAQSNWDLWMEVEPGKFKIAKIYGGADAVGAGKPPAVEKLRQGETVHYPRLVVRPAFGFNVSDWTQVDKDDFTLYWHALEPPTQAQNIEYELQMHLSAPSSPHDGAVHAPVVQSAKLRTKHTQWPISAQGVANLHLEPGNIYMFEVKAIDESGTVVARWPRTRVWLPWDYRQSNPPFTGHDTYANSPIHHGVWHRGSYGYGDGRKETLREKAARLLRESPDAFEYEYLRLGKAWLDWHDGDAAGARRELEDLARELPKGNLARGTAVWLLQQMDDNRDPPKRLNFVPDRETASRKAALLPDGSTDVRVEYGGSGAKLEFRIVPDATSAELNPEELERYKKDLAENGPVDSRRRSDKFAWFEIKSGVNVVDALVTEEYQGRNYLLLHNSEPFVMLPEQGWGLQRVEVIKDSRGRPAVGLEFDQKGVELLYELTKADLRKALAVILNGKVVSAPTIESAIRKTAVITGTFTEQEVQQMVQTLQRGLPPVKMGEQTGIDPTEWSAEFGGLHRQLKSEDSRQREDAARKLGQLRDTRAVDALIAALKDGEVAVRAGAARALGKIGDKRAVEPLIEAYQEQSYESFVDTLWALGDIGGTRAEQTLVAALNYQGYHPYVRNIAAKNLERLGWKPANREENMRFLIALERWEEAIKAGPAAYLKPAGTNQAEGPVEVSIPIVIPLQAEKQTPAISKYPQIEFSAVDGRLKATLYIRYASWPHTKWIITLELLDGDGQVLDRTKTVHSNTGTIVTLPHVENAEIPFAFAHIVEPARVAKFRFSIESIWTSRGNPLQFDKELPLALELNAAEQPGTISARWIKFENEGDNVRSTIHLRYLSWPKSKWEIRVTLLDANGKQLSDARAIVENSGTVFGVPNSTEKGLQFWLGQQAVAGEDIRYVVTIQKIPESNEMPAQPAFG